jgi:hypothetical protein
MLLSSKIFFLIPTEPVCVDPRCYWINRKLGDLQAILSLYDEKVCHGMKKQVDDRISKIEDSDPRSSILEGRAALR